MPCRPASRRVRSQSTVAASRWTAENSSGGGTAAQLFRCHGAHCALRMARRHAHRGLRGDLAASSAGGLGPKTTDSISERCRPISLSERSSSAPGRGPPSYAPARRHRPATICPPWSSSTPGDCAGRSQGIRGRVGIRPRRLCARAACASRMMHCLRLPPAVWRVARCSPKSHRHCASLAPSVATCAGLYAERIIT